MHRDVYQSQATVIVGDIDWWEIVVEHHVIDSSCFPEQVVALRLRPHCPSEHSAFEAQWPTGQAALLVELVSATTAIELELVELEHLDLTKQRFVAPPEWELAEA
jgi:hypothetical protein